MAAIAAILAAGCAPRGADRVRLGIGAQQSPSQLLIYLARDLGFFEACGAPVDVEEFPGSGKAMEALVGGSLDVLSGYHEQTLQLPEGAPAVMSFVAMTNGHLVALAVSPAAAARGVTGLRDLNGRNVGVTTLGSATHLWLNHLVRTRRGEVAGINPIAISTAARAVAAMEREGVVEAGVVSDFTVRTLEKRHGAVRILTDTRTAGGARAFYGVDQYPGTALLARRDWIATHRDTARALVCAVGRARTWAREHSPKEVAARLPFARGGGSEDTALYTEVIRGTVAMLTPDGRIAPEGAEAARRLSGGTRPAAQSYTNEFIE